MQNIYRFKKGWRRRVVCVGLGVYLVGVMCVCFVLAIAQGVCDGFKVWYDSTKELGALYVKAVCS